MCTICRARAMSASGDSITQTYITETLRECLKSPEHVRDKMKCTVKRFLDVRMPNAREPNYALTQCDF